MIPQLPWIRDELGLADLLAKPAKFVVFFVKDKGAPVLVPAN